MNADDVKRLQLAELHESTGGDADRAPKLDTVITTMKYESGATHIEVGNITVYVGAKNDFVIIRGSDCGDAQIEEYELDTLIALLQRAQTLIKGGVLGWVRSIRTKLLACVAM